MSRSIWKFPFIDKSLLKKIGENYNNHQTWSRRSVIYPAIVGKTLKIYDGRNMIKREIYEEMVGHKLGEFVRTRKVFCREKEKG
uniref:ribosomal protein S19 n=1 Tax=Ishige okamurae TaxID=233772 RepID=UPI002E76CABA|nr:ribosomal protein S19 [Ishige okamurae]WBP70201.1 ribosomal protein S19 [Ishige okamurae]